MATVKNQLRLKKLDILKELLENNPEFKEGDVKVVMSYNLGWSFNQTSELLKTLERAGDMEHKVFEPEDPIEINRPDTWGETTNELL